ncbi:MAG: TonB-dependent receptor plug domain-containing protein [Oligoflexus sp.]
MTTPKSWLAVRKPLIFSGLLTLTAPAIAQTSPDVDPEEPETQKVERIQVTGSRIKRMDVEGTTPITVISRDDIEQSGVTSVADLLRRTTASPLGNFAGTGGYVRSGASTVNLLGLGANRTLVLMDGKRLPVDVSVGAVNINNIPLAIVERIEIVSGGQSAIYGADAVGGVLNIITRKDFVGNEASIFASAPEHGGGETKEVTALSAFKPSENVSLAFTLGYKTTNETLRRNRDFVNGVFPRDFTASQAPAGQYSWRVLTPDRGPWSPSPDCPADRQRATVPEQPQNVYCAGSRDLTESWLTPNSEEWYVTARTDWNLSPLTRMSGIFLYSENKSEYLLGNYMSPMLHPLLNHGLLISPDKANEFGITGFPENAENIELYASSRDFENRMNNNTDAAYGGTVQLETMLDNWDLSSSLSFYRSTNKRDFLNVINKRRSIDLLFSQVDPEYLPFDPNRDPAVVNSIHDDLRSTEKADNFFVDVIGSTELFELPGGPLAIAVGTSFQTEAYRQTPSELDLLQLTDNDGVAIEPLYEGTASTSGSGSREVYSVFTELMAPVVSGLEINAAARYDQYSDFGGTLNYSMGSIWKATDYLALRGTTSSSYKAPNLNMVHSDSGGGYVGIQDQVWCQREREIGNICEPGGGQTLYVDRPGNLDIKEEVGRSYNIGFIFEPMQQFSLITDYYGIFVKDRHSFDRVQQVADDFYDGNAVDVGPNTSTVGPNIISWEESEVGGETQRVITSIKTPWNNIGAIEAYAIDAKANFNFSFGDFRLNHDTSLFRFLSYKVQDYRDEPLRQAIGYKGTPKWRMRNDLNLNYQNKHGINLGVQTIGRQIQDPEFARAGRAYYGIDEYSEWDLSYRWRHKWQGEIMFGVTNLFDTIGGKDSSGGLIGSEIGSESTDTSLYSIRGRSYFAKITQRF